MWNSRILFRNVSRKRAFKGAFCEIKLSRALLVVICYQSENKRYLIGHYQRLVILALIEIHLVKNQSIVRYNKL